jgi:Spy/CpxP family protein refolding chaperone
MRFAITLCGLALCLMMAAPPAQGAQDSASFSRDSTRHRIWAQLGLSESQKAKLKEMRKQSMEFRKQNFEKMKVLLDKSKEELLKPSPSKAVLHGYAKEMGDLHRTMAEQMADHMIALKSVLTKEQFEKLLSNEFRPPMPGGHGGDGPHHGPPGGHGGPPDFDE